jgi:hypothetical protein
MINVKILRKELKLLDAVQRVLKIQEVTKAHRETMWILLSSRKFTKALNVMKCCAMKVMPDTQLWLVFFEHLKILNIYFLIKIYQEEIEHLGVELIQSTIHHSLSDIDSYHQSKNFAFLLLNLALLASNGNQIKYILESPEQRPFFYYSLTFIALSLFFQFIAKAFSLSSYRYSLSTREGASKLKFINGFLLIFTMIITILNIGISVLILFEIYEILPW